MRVIAGTSGGIRLVVPKTDIRPTMDRVKAAIFSSLGERVLGAHVLDLFAGTGALGIEALSRGAVSAMFVESDRHTVTAIERNLAQTGLSGRIRQQDVFDFLRRPVASEQFDLIFADPPYGEMPGGEAFTRLLLKNKQLASLLKPGGFFVLEKAPEELLITPPSWQIVRAKRYGATEVLFLHHSRCP